MYASPEYFKDEFVGLYDGDDLEKRLRQASDKIDILTFNRIRGVGFDQLTSFQQEVIQKVVCQMVDFEAENTDLITSPVTSYAINGVSMQFGNSWNVVTDQGIAMHRHSYELLKQTGLMRRTV